MKDLGMVLVGIWLVGHGLIELLHLRFAASGTLLSALAVVAGALLLIERKGLQLSGGNLGTLLLALWLIATGLVPLLGLSFPLRDPILAGVGLAAGILLLLRR